MREIASITNKTHGLSKHPIYSLWIDIKKRCFCTTNWAYKYYGGRGITMHPKWKSDFMAFYNWAINNWAINNGWKKGLTIDRIDNDKNYKPSNCQFITQKKNSLKKRALCATNTSGYKGVSWHKRDHRYAAYITIEKQTRALGYFDDPIEAAYAYDKKAKAANDGRSINFP